jgi:hypothetical protein
LYNKYKRKREGDEDTGDYKIYKKLGIPGYFQYGCELLENDDKSFYEIFKEYPSIFTRHNKSLERIVNQRDRLKKRPVPEVTWIYDPSGVGEIKLVDKFIDSHDIMHKVSNYYLGLTGDKNIVHEPLCPKEKYSDILQMFTDKRLQLNIKYGYYNFFPEKLINICHVHPREFCSKCKPQVEDCSELLKRINRIIECSWDYKTKTPIYTEWK